MLTLHLQPFWLDILPGQRTRFRPVDRDMMLAARDVAKVGDAFDMNAFALSLATQGIVAWEGVGDADGQPLAVSPETVAAYLQNWRVFDAVRDRYVLPAVRVDDEKNASAPSSNGTSGARIRAKASAATARKNARRAPTA